MLHVCIRAVLLCFYVFSSCQNRVRVDSSLAWSVCQFVLARLPNIRRVVRRIVPHLISSHHRFSRFANESAPWTISFSRVSIAIIRLADSGSWRGTCQSTFHMNNPFILVLCIRKSFMFISQHQLRGNSSLCSISFFCYPRQLVLEALWGSDRVGARSMSLCFFLGFDDCRTALSWFVEMTS